jgi:hypothetical protein
MNLFKDGDSSQLHSLQLQSLYFNIVIVKINKPSLLAEYTQKKPKRKDTELKPVVV